MDETKSNIILPTHFTLWLGSQNRLDKGTCTGITVLASFIHCITVAMFGKGTMNRKLSVENECLCLFHTERRKVKTRRPVVISRTRIRSRAVRHCEITLIDFFLFYVVRLCGYTVSESNLDY